jgi:hypothetical protein
MSSPLLKKETLIWAWGTSCKLPCCMTHCIHEPNSLFRIPLVKSTNASTTAPVPAPISAPAPPKKAPLSTFSPACALLPSVNFTSSSAPSPYSPASSIPICIPSCPSVSCVRPKFSVPALSAPFLHFGGRGGSSKDKIFPFPSPPTGPAPACIANSVFFGGDTYSKTAPGRSILGFSPHSDLVMRLLFWSLCFRIAVCVGGWVGGGGWGGVGACVRA